MGHRRIAGPPYLWILTRTPTLDAARYSAAVAAASANGFDVSRLARP